jgi:hypothetical protein
MSLLLTFCITLLVTAAASSIIGVCFRLLRWRLLALAAFSLCIILAVARPDDLLSMSASEGGAMMMLVMLFAPFYCVACVMGILFGDFLRKRMVSKTDSRHDT